MLRCLLSHSMDAVTPISSFIHKALWQMLDLSANTDYTFVKKIAVTNKFWPSSNVDHEERDS